MSLYGLSDSLHDNQPDRNIFGDIPAIPRSKMANIRSAVHSLIEDIIEETEFVPWPDRPQSAFLYNSHSVDLTTLVAGDVVRFASGRIASDQYVMQCVDDSWVRFWHTGLDSTFTSASLILPISAFVCFDQRDITQEGVAYYPRTLIKSANLMETCVWLPGVRFPRRVEWLLNEEAHMSTDYESLRLVDINRLWVERGIHHKTQFPLSI